MPLLSFYLLNYYLAQMSQKLPIPYSMFKYYHIMQYLSSVAGGENMIE